MKKSNLYFLLGLAAWVLLPSCKKDPETEPRDLITEAIVWDKNDVNAFYAKQF